MRNVTEISETPEAKSRLLKQSGGGERHKELVHERKRTQVKVLPF